MRDLIVTVLPWILSGVTIAMTWLAGNKHRRAWALALGGQLLWLIWILASGSWGLLPMNAALWIVYYRNHVRWQDEKPDPVSLPAPPTVPAAIAPLARVPIAWPQGPREESEAQVRADLDSWGAAEVTHQAERDDGTLAAVRAIRSGMDILVRQYKMTPLDAKLLLTSHLIRADLARWAGNRK